MKRTQKFALLFVLMLLSALFAIQASASTLDEYKANNPQLDFSATEELTATQKNSFEEALAAATTIADAPYSTVVEQELVDALALASKVIAYEGLQARLSEGADGIRSRYSVDRAALAALEEYGVVSFGAIMGVAEMNGETGLNSSDALKVFYSEREGWLASGYRTTSVVVYDKGVDTGAYTDGEAKSHFAYTTIYDDAYANGAAYSSIAMVYRGFVIVNVDGTDHVLYVDGIGENFGAEGTLNGAATTLSELAQYMVEAYKEDGVRVYGENEKLRNIVWGVHNFDVAQSDGSRVCLDCGHVDKPILEAPTADVADFSVEVTDFDGKITVPAEHIGASGFYWVTLEGVTVASKGYTYLYNENGKAFASKNRDKEGATYSVYLEAGHDNVLTYEGATLTKASFKLAEPTSADTIIMTSSEKDLTANTVENAAFKDGVVYQMRAGSILNYKKAVTVAEGGFYTIGAALCGGSTGEVFFTFTADSGLAYTVSFNCASIAGAIGVEIVTNGSESFRYAADLMTVYLPEGEYALTVSKVGGGQTSIGVITMNPVAHMCRDAVAYEQEATCTQNGMTGEGCPICLNGVTVVPATGHAWDSGIVTGPTCDAEGGTLYTCTVCSETKIDDPVPATGHTWDDGVETLAPGCTTPGVTTFTCTVCTTGTKTEPIAAKGHSWGDWVANAEETEETRICGVCTTPETRPISKDGKTLTPTFTTTDNKSWTITVSNDQIVHTGIYALYFKTEGTWVKAYGCLTTSGSFTMANRFKDTSVDADGYSVWSFQTYIEKGTDDVTLTLSFKSTQGDISEMKLVLLAKVAGYTTVDAKGKTGNVTMNGTITGVAAGDYKLATFANCFGIGVLTVNVADATNSKTYAVSAKDTALPTEGVDGTLVYTYSSANYDGSTGTAHYIEIGDVTCDGTDIAVTYTATVAEQGNKIESASAVAGGSAAGVYPVFIVIPVTAE